VPEEQVALNLDEDAIKEVTDLARLTSAQVEKKFIRLRDQWKANRGHHSDTVSLVIHPAYQQIIGMGPEVIPLLLRELATAPDRWYWALRAITCEDPVPPEARGNSKAMAQAWLKWGKEQGYQW
jgi:hypothetical protein